MGILTLAIVIIGVLVQLKYSAILGIIIYLVGFGFSWYQVQKNYAHGEAFSISKTKDMIKKETFFSEGIYAVIVLTLPIFVCIGLFSWIYLDSVRSAEYASHLFD